MHSKTFLHALAAAGTAAIVACTDSANPVHPPAVSSLAASNRATCKPPTPDASIPLPIAPRSQRVDLATPRFSHPTNVTNPLFPIKNLKHAILVGEVDGLPFRAETTLLPATKSIYLDGGPVETLVSQYVAYLDGRIQEQALDWYAQADDGSVWYFGEDVFNYEAGVVVDRDGTWLACKDGPAAMIMPRNPRVSDVFRVENIYPVVFEEVEVMAVNQTVPGPLGLVTGAITVSQLHLDGTYAPKTFAPGYGEFSTGSDGDIESLALALPINAAPGATPVQLRTILIGASTIFRAAGSGNWTVAETAAAEMQRAWRRYRAQAPRLLKPIMTGALATLSDAVASRDRALSRQSSIDVAKDALDIALRFRTRVEVDRSRLKLLVKQLVIDVEAEDSAGIGSDVAIFGLILDRLAGTSVPVGRLRREIAAVGTASERGNLAAVLRGAERLQNILDDDESDETDE